MLWVRWGKAVGQMLLIFLVAGILAVVLLHVQAGWLAGKGFHAEAWLKATQAYVRDLAGGDLGTVQPLRMPGYNVARPVGEILLTEGSRSLIIMLGALAVSLGLGTVTGLLASRFGPRWLRQGVFSVTLLLLSTPDLLLVLLVRRFVMWSIGTFGISFLKVGALTDPGAFDYVVPILTLAAVPLAVTARVATVAFDEVHEELYLRTARSKGLAPWRVVWTHAFKNAWIKVLAAAPLIAGTLATGLVVVEYILFFPGIGRLLGLILERRTAPQPGAAASIALALVLVTLLVQAVLGAIRLGLDRRMGGGAGGVEVPRMAPVPWATAIRDAVANLRELPYQLSQAVWRWRPGTWLRELRSNPALLIGAIGVLALGFVALFGGHFANVEAIHKVPRYIIHEDKPYFPPYAPGTPGYPLGSDLAGRDLLARLVVGARYTLFFALTVTPVRFLIALPWGLLAGFRGRGWAGASRTLGLLVTALPLVLVPVALLPPEVPLEMRNRVADSGSTLMFWQITLVLAVAGVPRLTENIRQLVESTLVQPFVEGAAAAGAGAGRVLRRHVLPHLAPQLWAAAATDVAWTLLMLAQLGLFSIYLGGSIFVMTGAEVLGNSSGVPVPRIPDWSSMLGRPYDVIYKAPWALWFPAAAFLLAVVIFNLLAEGLRRRAQRFAPAPDVATDQPRARRRLALEWGVALLALLAVGGATVRYGFASKAVWYAEVPSDPLGRTRYTMQVLLDEIQGSADSLNRSKAAAQLRRVMTAYLVEAQASRLSATQIQEDARGRVDVFEVGGLRIVSTFVPGAVKGGHIFVAGAGEIAYMNTEERPNAVAVIGDGVRRRLMLAGTVPGPDNWQLSIWYGPTQLFDGLGYYRDRMLAQQLFSQLTPGSGASLPMQGQLSEGRLVTTQGPRNSIRLDRSGDVEVCQGQCQTVRWTGDHFEAAP